MSRISEAISRQQDSAVTHTLKSVRHHRIDFRLPAAPGEHEEAFVISTNQPGGDIRLRPQDFQQFITTLRQVRQQIMGGEL